MFCSMVVSLIIVAWARSHPVLRSCQFSHVTAAISVLNLLLSCHKFSIRCCRLFSRQVNAEFRRRTKFVEVTEAHMINTQTPTPFLSNVSSLCFSRDFIFYNTLLSMLPCGCLWLTWRCARMFVVVCVDGSNQSSLLSLSLFFMLVCIQNQKRPHLSPTYCNYISNTT